MQMKLTTAQSILWDFNLFSVFTRKVKREQMITGRLAKAVRVSIQGPVKRYGFADGSVIESTAGKYKVVRK